MRSWIGARTVAAVAVVAFLVPAAAAAGVTVSGVVKAPDGQPSPATRVVLTEADRATFTGEDGRFRFDDVAPGFYHVRASSPRYGDQVVEVDVGEDDVELVVELGYMAHHETLVVSTASVRGASELIQPVNVLEKSDLIEKMQPTLGETLKNQPGLNSTQYGNGTSRPVIRGQGAGRIRVLEGGLDVGDASSTSPDHAVGIDMLGTERVEVLRGPATLLYGNTAVGGVVNTIDERVPDHVPQSKAGGSVELRAGSVADERAAAAELRGGAGAVAYYVNAFRRDVSDYAIPGNAIVGDPTSASGTLANSAVDNRGATVGLSWVGENGYVGVAGRSFDSLYGIPVALEEEGIRIDLEQSRYDLRGGFDTDFGPFDGIDFSLGLVDYEHRELVDGEIGTRFFQDSVDSRVELSHGGFDGKLRGVAGLQVGRRDLEAIGDEAFLPPSITDHLALFAVEEVEHGRMIYEAGVRVSTQDTSADLRPDRDFTGASGSLGVLAKLGESYRVGGSISRTERFPRAEELYSDGPHLATLTFERGDPDLDPEVSAGIDVSLRKIEGRVSGELTLFVNRYDGYIYEAPQFDALGQPEIEDGLPVFLFSQRDAEFLGGEVDIHVHVWESGSQHLGVQLMGDYVRAEFTDGGTPIPFMPPWRAGTAVHYRGARWHASVDVLYHAEQDRVPTAADFGGAVEPEFAGLYGLTPTDGYTMVDAHVGYRLAVGRAMLHEVLLRGTNLTDEEARNAVSRLKDFVPLPGRDLALIYRLVF